MLNGLSLIKWGSVLLMDENHKPATSQEQIVLLHKVVPNSSLHGLHLNSQLSW